jgi:hypothetical protein
VKASMFGDGDDHAVALPIIVSATEIDPKSVRLWQTSVHTLLRGNVDRGPLPTKIGECLRLRCDARRTQGLGLQPTTHVEINDNKIIE